MKRNKYAIGLMSGTSVDGIDAVLVEISDNYDDIKQLAFFTKEFSKEERERILKVANGDFGGSKEISQLNFYLGELFADACQEVCKIANVKLSDIDFVGSHGQTVHHVPNKEQYLHKDVSSTLQIGEASVIAQRIGCVVVSDFRVRDMSAGGLGAPLVPYTEYLLFSSNEKNRALQNIGGIGNITYLPKGGTLDDLLAFDTGPGNMIIDALVEYATDNKLRYDKDGAIAKSGNINEKLLEYMMDNEYLRQMPPKTTGREYFGKEYVLNLLEKAKQLNVSTQDTIATATYFTAKTIQISVENFCPLVPDELIIGGGGSRNPVLMQHIRECFTSTKVLTGEDLGYNSDAKEAIAFAVLANETLNKRANNACKATGAKQSVIMGKISY